MSKTLVVIAIMITPLLGSTAAAVEIHDLQGAGHISPFNGMAVIDVPGVVTATLSNGFYMQDTPPDSDDATSEGIFVFTSSAPTVAVGDAVLVAGTVVEFRAGGGGSTNLTSTEIVSPSIAVLSSGNPLPAPAIIGTGGRIPPSVIIEDDATGDVESSGIFDPAFDGIDFYESLEGMLVQVNDPVTVGPRSSFGEIPVLGDDGINASVRTARAGIVVQASDFNPERIILDDALQPTPTVNVGDHFTAPVVGILDYSFGTFKLEVTSTPTAVSAGLMQEATSSAGPGEIAIATFNLEELGPDDGVARFAALASQIVTNLQSPDIIAVQEIEDNNGPVNDSVVDATTTYMTLIAAIQSAGGPTYQFRNIDPVDDQDGGEPGGNVRVGFLFRTDRGLMFVDRPGGDATTATTVLPGPQLSFSPGRIDPTNAAFDNSRKPLAGEFLFNSHKLFLIVNHLSSKGGDQPLFGHFQPPALISEVQRVQQTQVVSAFVGAILAADPNTNVVVLGDLNDFEFSPALNTLKGGGLEDLVEALPENERYSFIFEGNSQALDHILVSSHLSNDIPFAFDVAHVNSEFVSQASDHDPEVVRFAFGPVETGARSMGFWQKENGQAIISRSASIAGICDLTRFLRTYAPFQDLSATASCSSVAAYVYSVIKAASASGASMNRMLKAQMLATALDVYFSDPALGGDEIDVPAPIGSVAIDLTMICDRVGTTCGGTFKDTSPAFGGAPSLTVAQMLASAASQSNVGGSVWYANVKSVQECAKDAFDAINNQVAFPSPGH